MNKLKLIKELRKNISYYGITKEHAKNKPDFYRPVVTLYFNSVTEVPVKAFIDVYMSQYAKSAKIGIAFNRRAVKLLLREINLTGDYEYAMSQRHSKVAVEDVPSTTELVIKGTFVNAAGELFVPKYNEVRAAEFHAREIQRVANQSKVSIPNKVP